MNRSRTYRWARRAVWATFAVVLAFGCSPLQTAAFLFHRDTKVPAECPLTFKDGPKKDKDEVVVAVFVSQGSGQSFEFAGAEGAIASELAKKLPEMAKENKEKKQKLVVLAAKDVNKFKYENPNWKLMAPSEWGRRLKADFVLDVHLDKLSLYQPGSLNQIYEGRAEVSVDTYEVDAGPGEPKFSYALPFAYPRTGVRDASTIPPRTFKQEFLEHLSVEIAHKHVDYKPSDGIAEGP